MPDRPAPNVPPTASPDDKTLAETVFDAPPTSTGDVTRAFTMDNATVTDDSTLNSRTKGRAVPGDEPDILPAGTVIEGKYDILGCIGSGGMGSVYRAKHRTLNRDVAIKVMKPDYARNREAVERFRREAQLCAMVEHPNSIRVFDHGVQDGMCFLVMELLHGQTLGDRLTQRGALPPGEVAVVGERILQVLALLHRKGIVHRDLKPDNIFFAVDPDQDDDEELTETVKLLDFGIAKQADTAGPVTNTGAIVGTPFYMSPEQCEGRTVDNRSDIYSLGVILFEMLAGKPPFGGSNLLGVLFQHVNNPPPSLRERAPSVPDAMVAVVNRMLEKLPEQRFQKASEAAAALCAAAGIERAASGTTLTPETAGRTQPTQSMPPTPLAPVTRETTAVPRPDYRRRAAALGLVGILALGLVWQRGAISQMVALANYRLRGTPPQISGWLVGDRKATVERSISALAAHLSETLGKKENDVWTTAQMATALHARATIDSARVQEFLTRNCDPATASWNDDPSAPPNVVISGWVAIGMARNGYKMTPAQLEFFLNTQQRDGWWTLYALKSTGPAPPEMASTYATAMATLGIHEQLLLGIDDPKLAERIRTAVKLGRDWIVKTRIPDQARWYDYPSNTGQRVQVGVSGLAMHVLHRTAPTFGAPGDLADIDARWLDNLPRVEMDAKAVETTQISLTLGQREDTTKQYPLQWAFIATADAYPNGSPSARAKALVWIDDILAHLDAITDGVIGKTDWMAAEWLISLRKFNGEKVI
jgi:serine/threonine protein kinase